MERVLNLAGKNSSEIFQLRYPFSLLSFCDYDLSYFAENAVAVCDEALRSGELDIDRVTDLRNSLRNMHVYIEHNLRTVYDKIVLDCWIDYVCRRDSIGTTGLWNRFIDCKTAFEKAVFVRLCEYRYNKGINEWLNLVRVQDYAKNKVYFLFSRELSGVEEASARRNYFDLMFSVTARELGCRLEDLGVTQVFSAGRVPSAPFMYPGISKDIVKNVLADFDYSDDYSDIGQYDEMADQIAMDAFSHMKAGLEQEFNSYNMSRPAMENAPGKIYMPCGLKAAVDLEIDALLESGGWLARCKRCGRYYVKDADYTEDYCSLPTTGGKTCLEIYEAEHPRSRVTPELEKQCAEIMDEMYARTTAGSLSIKEYDSWRLYLEAMKSKVNNGEIQPEDLRSFISYSRSMDISRSNPVVEVKKPSPEPHERVVKPFVPERISRSDIDKAPIQMEEPEPVPEPQPRREGFFTSPSVERQKSRTVSHVIRAERAGSEARPYQMPLNQASVQPERGFTAFASPEPEPAVIPEQRTVSEAASQRIFAAENSSTEYFARDTVSERGFTAFGETQPTRIDIPEAERVTAPPESIIRATTEEPRQPSAEISEPEHNGNEPTQKSGFIAFENTEPEQISRADLPENKYASDMENFDEPTPEWENTTPEEKPEPVPQVKPAPRIIKKNAAAISAYGKMAGTAVKSDASFEAVSRPEQHEHAEPEKPEASQEQSDPFWEIGSIFDVLEQSENDMLENNWIPDRDERKSDKPKPEPKKQLSQPEHQPDERPESAPKKRRAAGSRSAKPSADEVPSGIWTEDRHLYDGDTSDTHEELNMLKDKKRRGSNKTQRLFDAIMKEPDDNPNFRKK